MLFSQFIPPSFPTVSTSSFFTSASSIPFLQITKQSGIEERREVYEGGDMCVYIYINLWLIHTVSQQKPTQFGKEIFLQLKKKLHVASGYHGVGNGNPLQCSCLENPRDRGACWAAVYGVTQSCTQLMWLSSSSSGYHKGQHRSRKFFYLIFLKKWNEV